MKRSSFTLTNRQERGAVRKAFNCCLAFLLAFGLSPLASLQAWGDEQSPAEENEWVAEDEGVSDIDAAVDTEEALTTEDTSDLDADAIFREEGTPTDEPASAQEDFDREESDPSDIPASKYEPYTATDYDEIYDLLYAAHENELQTYTEVQEELGNTLFTEDASMGASEAKSSDRVMETAAMDYAATAGDGGYSDTNVQVEGIDEADIIKTDGAYIYRLSTDGEIYILKADGADSKAVSHFTLSDSKYADSGLNYSTYPFALYVADGKLIVLRSLSYWNNTALDDGVQPLPGIEPRAEAATAAVEEDVVGETTADEATVDKNETATDGDEATKAPATTDEAPVAGGKSTVGQSNVKEDSFSLARFMAHDSKIALSTTLTVIDVFDITDPSKPTQLYQLAQSGSNNTSRLTDNTLTLITSTYLFNFIDAKKDDAATYIPCTFDNAGVTKVVDADHVFVFPGDSNYDYDNYTTIARFDITTGELLDSYAMMGNFGETYMSPNALYIARNHWINNDSDPYEDSVYTVVDSENYSQTTITRLDITDEALTLGPSATLDGYLRNQFNMDEYNGYLRVALCDDRSYSRELKDDSHDVDVYQFIESKTTNGLYVLDEAMEVVGSIEDIAPGEEIKSVRFDGPMGYVVTFEQIDPLFAISLVSPTNPEILSALKIPGFSSYLHPFGEGRLLGFGQSVENNMTTGLKLSMYDTTDPADVTEIATYDIDGSYSTALYDHHAIFVSVDLGIIGVPVDDEYQLFSYSEEDGFTPYSLSDDGEGLTSEVLGYYGDPRGLFSGDNLYVCSNWVLVVYNLETGELLTTVEFKDLPKQEYGPYYSAR